MTSTEPVPTRASSMPRIPSLDGLRAISILLVMGLHTLQRHDLSHHSSFLWYALFNGGTGVYIFFVISGYLITSLLLHEQSRTGGISLGSFYLRRAFRILPPLYFYVAVVALCAALGRLALPRIDLLSALFFFHNYAATSMGWSVEHFWSLSVEEQFYLIWPVVLILCLSRPGPLGPGPLGPGALGPGALGRRLALRFALVVIAISPAVRVGSFRLHNTYWHNGGMFQMAADSLMFGCVVALLQGTPRFEKLYLRVTRLWWLPPAIILFCMTMDARFQNYWSLPLGLTIEGTAIAAFMLWCVRNPRSAVGRFLNLRPVAYVGVLSYSAYLWQTLFLHHGSVQLFGGSTVLNTFPGDWIAVFAAALFSYHIIEKPSLRLRTALTRRHRLRSAAGHALTPGR